MQADLEARAMQAVELTKKSGADDAWATASQARDVEFEYRDGALEKVQDTTARSLAIQVYSEGRYSSHRTTDLNPDRLQSFIDEAVAITRALEPDKDRKITSAELFKNRPNVDLEIVDPQVFTLDREQRVAFRIDTQRAVLLHAERRVEAFQRAEHFGPVAALDGPALVPRGSLSVGPGLARRPNRVEAFGCALRACHAHLVPHVRPRAKRGGGSPFP